MDEKEMIQIFINRFFYKNGILYSKKTNKPCGSVSKYNGYTYSNVRFNGKVKLIPHHRIIFAMHFKYFPKYIDHANGNRSDNSIDNLRECSFSNNMQNRKRAFRKNSTSIYKGVRKRSDHKRIKIWDARLDNKHLGIFKTEEEAAIAYNIAAKEAYGEFAYQNIIQGDRK